MSFFICTVHSDMSVFVCLSGCLFYLTFVIVGLYAYILVVNKRLHKDVIATYVLGFDQRQIRRLL